MSTLKELDADVKVKTNHLMELLKRGIPKTTAEQLELVGANFEAQSAYEIFLEKKIEEEPWTAPECQERLKILRSGTKNC